MKKEFIDFKAYTDPKDVKGYELFIGPWGEYYKVKTKFESDENCTHYEWALNYLNDKAPNIFNQEDVISKCKSPTDILINVYGFIRYTHSYGYSKPIFNFPDQNLFGYYLSREQKESVYKLLNFNKETITPELVDIIENRDKRDNIIDGTYNNFIRK